MSRTIIAALFGATVMLCGCKAIEDAQYKPAYVMAFYEVLGHPGQAELLEQEARDPVTGKIYWYNKNQFFDSKHIMDVEITPAKDEPGYYNVYFKLNHAGMTHWVAMCGHTDRLLMMLDGAYYTVFAQKLEMRDNKSSAEWVRCNVKLDEITANGIKEHAVKNYEYFNPDNSQLF